MKRLAIFAAALAAAALAWAAADPSRYEKYGLEITFPDKWIVGTGEAPLLLISRSMDQVSLANCVATGEDVAATRGLTQDQINLGLSQAFGEEFWRQVYSTSGLVADVKSQGARAHKSGLTIQEAQFDLSKQGAADGAKMTVHQAIFVRPGHTVVVACSARAIAYAKQKSVLAGVIESVRFGAPSTPVASGEASVMPVKAKDPTPADLEKAMGNVARAGVALIEVSK
jgi:hypothetical protein